MRHHHHTNHHHHHHKKGAPLMKSSRSISSPVGGAPSSSSGAILHHHSSHIHHHSSSSAHSTAAVIREAEAAVAPSQYSYEAFTARNVYVLDKLYKGTYYTETGTYQGAPIEFGHYAPPITPPGTIVKPHTELWNVYWETFFGLVAQHLEAIRKFITLNTMVDGIYNKAEKVMSSRRVVVKCPGSLLFAAPDDESGYPQDLRAFAQLAEAFGAVTDINLTESEVHITYTVPRTAEMCSEYLRQTGFRLTDGVINMGGINTFPAAPNNRDAMSCLLKLGPHVDIGLPYVSAIFTDIFDARVEFNPTESSYLIKFKDSESARFCHHVLHQSFFKVFGLALVVVRIKTAADTADQVRRGDWDIPYHALRAV